MRHSYGRNLLYEAFDVMTVDAVWLKGTIVPGVNPNLIRKDRHGFWIERYNYGDQTEHGTGWEINHIISVDDGGGDHLDNLQPLQWQNNRSGTDYSGADGDFNFATGDGEGWIGEDYLALDELNFE